MKTKIGLIVALTGSLFSTSCVIEPPDARKMTFENAMQSLSNGMRTLREGAPKEGEKQLGLVPTEMTATFELSRTASGELGVNLAAVPTGPLSSGSLSAKNSQGVNRKNTVTVVFKNVFVDKDGKPRPVTDTQLPPTVVIPGGSIDE